ncbi:L-threonylcarbamoyladenylate synthase [Evansella vedderi]|uniref:Threonylcarbamoyl-AMP synthase n=1 Tax=Evansella vedderi TaxID=38282 RepID=A0ABU0A1S5_9BACI|nr:L-threonylcarbamoyladenylate synthase [Evansella vedderi]MDQ0257180.1 L-threonylcarbamoyladenylate synthase [Evansella vedderi]
MDHQNTDILNVGKTINNLEEDPSIQIAAQRLQEGEVVAFPTETVYGLGGNALSDKAIHRIFQAKGRPSDNPLIVHIADENKLDDYVEKIPSHAQKLMEAYWPGPLTIVLEDKGKLSTGVTAGLSTVAVRMPDHPIALALIRAANLPLAAPSANTSGKPSPTTAQHVYKDLKGSISTIIDGGPTGVGVESTVVDCTGKTVTILRPGGITKEQLEEVVGPVDVDPALITEDTAPKSPGMKYTHYAPSAPLVLVDGSPAFFEKKISEARASGKRVGILISEENKGRFIAHKEVVLGSKKDLSTVAAKLYESLRIFNEQEVDIIFSEVYPEMNLGAAIMNRLRKAAGGNVLVEHLPR